MMKPEHAVIRGIGVAWCIGRDGARLGQPIAQDLDYYPDRTWLGLEGRVVNAITRENRGDIDAAWIIRRRYNGGNV